MKKFTKVITITASCMVVIGVIMAVISFFSGASLSIIKDHDGFYIHKPEDLKTETHSLSSFNSINAKVTDANIEVIPSDTNKIEITQNDSKDITYEVKDDTLFIKDQGIDKGPKFTIGFFAGSVNFNKIKIYVPKSTDFSTLSIETKNGDVKITDNKSKNLLITASFGDVNLSTIHTTKGSITINDGDLSINSFDSNTLTVVNKFGDSNYNNVKGNQLQARTNDGDIKLKNITADKIDVTNHFGDIYGDKLNSNKLAIDMNDGDLQLYSLTAAVSTIKNNYGDTDLNDLRGKNMTIHASDGDIKIDGSLTGDSTISSNYGDIFVSLTNKKEINYSITSNFGDIIVNGSAYENSYSKENGSKNTITISAKDGDIRVSN